MLVFHQTFLTFISPNPDTSKRYAVVGDMLTAQTCRFENARCHDSFHYSLGRQVIKKVL